MSYDALDGRWTAARPAVRSVLQRGSSETTDRAVTVGTMRLPLGEWLRAYVRVWAEYPSLIFYQPSPWDDGPEPDDEWPETANR